MALRRIKNRWYVYYKENGHIHTISTKCVNREDAEGFERDYMRKVHLDRSRLRLKRFCGDLVPSTPEYVVRAQHEERLGVRGGVLLSSLFDLACRYRSLSETHRKAFNRFVKEVGLRYATEVTPKIALEYLEQNFGGGNGKSFNNNKTALNTIFKLTLVETGLSSSPFEKVLNRRVTDVESHRNITPEEFSLIFQNSEEPYRTLALISWHTGLRLESCLTLRWSDIDSDYAITKIPGKTSRFKRAVYIPMHKQLIDWLLGLPRAEEGNPIVSVFPTKSSGSCSMYFKRLFKRLQIGDNKSGVVSFHSFRSSFITRCDEAGIPRHAIQGVAGQRSETVTNLYSHDKITPRKILELSAADLGVLYPTHGM